MTVTDIVIDDRITVTMTGPIAPPTILIIFVAAEEIPVYSLGVNEIFVLFNVRGKRAPAIPNRNRPPLTACDVEWNSVSNKNEMAEIRMPGTSSFVFSPFLFPINSPKTGPKIIIDKPNANCNSPV